MRRGPAAVATGAFGLALLLCVAAPAVWVAAAIQRAGAPAPPAAPAAPSALPTSSAGGTLVARATTSPPAAPGTSGAPQGALPHGTIVIVRDTPHFWVADERGVLHWVAGTRALVGRYARWDAQRVVGADELERLPRGEPWLLSPAAFVGGERSELHVITWQSGVAWPALLRAPNLDSLRPLGITAEEVARRSTDRRTWERLLGLTVEDVAVDLMPLSSPPLWTSGRWSGIGTQVSPADTYEMRMSFAAPRVDPELGVVIGMSSYPSFPCSGYVGLLWAGTIAEEQEVLLTEWLDTGIEHCTIQGRVTLTRRTDTRLFYTWSLPDRPMAVSGILLRD